MNAELETTMAAASILLKSWADTLSADDLKACQQLVEDHGANLSVLITAAGPHDEAVMLTAFLDGLPGGSRVLFQHPGEPPEKETT